MSTSAIATLLTVQEIAHQSNNSGLAAQLIWIGVIAVVMVCLIILAVVGLSAHDKTKT